MISLCRGTPGASVLLLSHGPLEDLLALQGVVYKVLPLPSDVANVKRSSGIRASLNALPSILGFLRRLADRIREYDVVVPVSQKSFVLTILSRVFVRCPVIWYMNDLVSAEHFSKHLMRVMVFLANIGASHVIVNSQASRTSWLAAGGDADKCSVSYSGIDSSKVTQVSQDKVAAHRASFAANDKFVCVMVGRIASWKGQHVLLEALRHLPDVRGVFVGEAMFGEEAYEKQLGELIAENGLHDQCVFLGHREDVLEIMTAADAIVHCSTAAEPFGRVIVEGMMVGRPVIASDCGGPREIIEDGESGLLTKPGDASELKAAIRRLVVDQELADRVSRIGKERAHALFDANAMVNHFHDVRDRFVSNAVRASRDINALQNRDSQ